MNKSLIPVITAAALAFPGLATAAKNAPAKAAQAEPPIIAAPPGVAIDFFVVSETKEKGSRYVNNKILPKLGYVKGAPVLQIERLRSVKKIHTTLSSAVESADKKRRAATTNVPAIEMSLSNSDATAFANLMKRSIGQRILIEAEATPIYAPLVRKVTPTQTLTFSLPDDRLLDEVYMKLARFVKK